MWDRLKDEYIQTLALLQSYQERSILGVGAMEAFLEDYDRGCNEGRYVEGGLPIIPFGNRSKELALCSHVLFTYAAQLGYPSAAPSFRE